MTSILSEAVVPGIGPTIAQTIPLDGIGRLPFLMASPPTLALSAANAASSIAGSIQIQANEPNCFTWSGAVPQMGTVFPNYQGLGMITPNVYPITTAPPFFMEFVLDTVDATGRFELVIKGTGGGCRVLVWTSGQWQTASAAASFAPPADGNQYRGLVTMGAAGIYRIRVEFEAPSRVYGLAIAPTDGVSATSKRKVWIAIGDSFTEPTIVDTGSLILTQGWPCVLSYLTGWDVWCAGKGTTGYVTPGASVIFRSRLPELLAYSPYGILWAGGINDSSTTYDALKTEVIACLTAALSGGVPYTRQLVLSPFWRGDFSTVSSPLLRARDAIKDAAAACGSPFLDLIAPDPYPTPTGAKTGLLAAQANSGATSVSSSIPVPGDQNLVGTAYCILVGNVGSGTLEMRKVTGISGSGPYTLNFAGGLASTHPAGELIRWVGQPIWTGTGRQGATTGVGTSDRYVGNDNTHPTAAGHSFIARQVYKQMALQLIATGLLT